MKNRSLTTLAALALAGASFSAAYASDTALVDALVKKGVLKQAEAEKIIAESKKSGGDSSSKIKLNESVKELSIYGDLRLRWQHAQGNLQENSGNQTPLGGNNNIGVNQNQQVRLRLQLGTKVKLTDDITVGVEVSTQNTPTQRFTNMGAGNDYALGFSKAYISWTPTPEFQVIAGRQSVPFYSTEMVWDRDVRLDGVTEKVDLGKLLGLGDGFGLKLVAGQFIAGDNLAFNSQSRLRVNVTPSTYYYEAGRDNQDSWFYQTQLQMSADLGGAKVTFAPGILFSNGSNSSNIFKEFNGLNSAYVSANYTENMGTVLLPGDVSFDVSGVKSKFYWDFAYNYNAAQINSNDDRLAFLVGVQVGQNKAKGDLSASVNYRQVGAQAVNALYSDSDFGLGQLNQRGFKISTTYNLTANTTLTAAYNFTNNIDKDGYTTRANKDEEMHGAPSAILNSTQLVTIDLGVKF
jgi:hypothetical protein